MYLIGNRKKIKTFQLRTLRLKSSTTLLFVKKKLFLTRKNLINPKLQTRAICIFLHFPPFSLNFHQSVCMNKEIPFLPFLNYGITSSELISSQVFLIIFNPFLILFYGYQKIIQTAFCTRSRSLRFLLFLHDARVARKE